MMAQLLGAWSLRGCDPVEQFIEVPSAVDEEPALGHLTSFVVVDLDGLEPRSLIGCREGHLAENDDVLIALQYLVNLHLSGCVPLRSGELLPDRVSSSNGAGEGGVTEDVPLRVLSDEVQESLAISVFERALIGAVQLSTAGSCVRHDAVHLPTAPSTIRLSWRSSTPADTIELWTSDGRRRAVPPRTAYDGRGSFARPECRPRQREASVLYLHVTVDGLGLASMPQVRTSI
jgi:hypothetical protein